MKKILSLCLLCCFLKVTLFSLTDFELDYPHYVIETKKIDIPSRPHAFNPSIVRWRGSLLMCFRELLELPPSGSLSSAGNSIISMVWLDEAFEPISDPQTLPLGMSLPKYNLQRCDDARLLVVDDALYLIYSDNPYGEVYDGGFRMHVVELTEEEGIFSIVNNERLEYYEDAYDERREKNWVPFDFRGCLFLGYSIVPHKIYCPLLDGSGHCDTVACSRPSIVWEWGEMRGGTPALPIDDKYYLSFFHSLCEIPSVHSEGETVLHYFCGAYLFQRHPPFAIKMISPEPIVGKDFYHGPIYEPYWKPVRVVFPCGYILDGDYIWLSYGRQDHEVWVAKIDKQLLLRSMIPVTTVK